MTSYRGSNAENSQSVSTIRFGALRHELGSMSPADQTDLIHKIRADRLVPKRKHDPAGARSKRRDKIIEWFSLLDIEWQAKMLEELK